MSPCRHQDMPLIRTVAPVLIAVLFLLAWAPQAAANTYIVYSCKTRIGTPAPTDGLTPSQNTPTAETTNNCWSGGSLRSTLFGHVQQPSGARVSWHFEAPADTEIRQFDVWRTGKAYWSSSDTTMETAQYTTFPSADFNSDKREWCNSNVCSQRGFDTDAIDQRNIWWSGTLSGIRDVYFSAGCIGTGPCAARGTGGRPMAEMRVQGVQWVLTDDFIPEAETPTGDLVGDGPHKGIEAATFAATDRGSWLYRSLVELKAPGDDDFTTVKRGLVHSNDGRCAELEGFPEYEYEFGFTVPCRLSASVDVEWDTTTVPDGDYLLRVRVEDASGNVTTVSPAKAFKIDNVPPPAATVPPSVIGSAHKGSTLVGNRGQWNATTLDFQVAWMRCSDRDALDSCEPIAGATTDQYKVAPADLGRWLRFRVTATSTDGTGTAHSASVGRVTTDAGVIPQCADGLDNDGDGKTDTDDPACPSRENTDEAADTIPAGPFTPGGSSGSGGDGRGDPNGRNASDSARLTIAGGGRRTLPFGKGALTRLSLRDEAGLPIVNATVVVLQRMAVPGARWVPAHAPLSTDGDGRIRYAIAPSFSRKLRFAYRSHRGDARFAVTRDLTVNVISRSSLKTNRSYLRNGETVVFKGRLASRPVPRKGVVIDLQAQVGRRWQTFQTVRTSADGRWKSSYRFRSTTGLQTYTFRARVRSDTGYPYAPSISRRVKVRVRG